MSNLMRYVNHLINIVPNELHYGITVIGSSLIRDCTDFDIYVTNDEVLNYVFKGYLFPDGLELDIVDSLSTDDFELVTDDSVINLTDYVMSKLTKNFSSSSIKRLTLDGLFITKLAAWYDSFDNKHFRDLSNLKLSSNAKRVIHDFGLTEALHELSNC